MQYVVLCFDSFLPTFVPQKYCSCHPNTLIHRLNDIHISSLFYSFSDKYASHYDRLVTRSYSGVCCTIVTKYSVVSTQTISSGLWCYGHFEGSSLRNRGYNVNCGLLHTAHCPRERCRIYLALIVECWSDGIFNIPHVYFDQPARNPGSRHSSRMQTLSPLYLPIVYSPCSPQGNQHFNSEEPSRLTRHKYSYHCKRKWEN